MQQKIDFLITWSPSRPKNVEPCNYQMKSKIIDDLEVTEHKFELKSTSKSDMNVSFCLKKPQKENLYSCCLIHPDNSRQYINLLSNGKLEFEKSQKSLINNERQAFLKMRNKYINFNSILSTNISSQSCVKIEIIYAKKKFNACNLEAAENIVNIANCLAMVTISLTFYNNSGTAEKFNHEIPAVKNFVLVSVNYCNDGATSYSMITSKKVNEFQDENELLEELKLIEKKKIEKINDRKANSIKLQNIEVKPYKRLEIKVTYATVGMKEDPKQFKLEYPNGIFNVEHSNLQKFFSKVEVFSSCKVDKINIAWNHKEKHCDKPKTKIFELGSVPRFIGPFTAEFESDNFVSTTILIQKYTEKMYAGIIFFKPEIPSPDAQLCFENIFIIDRSGSMSGERIKIAKEALKNCLSCLEMENTTFNIISFGTDAKAFSPQSLEYNNENKEKALKDIEEYDADMEYTNILNALELVFKQELKKNTKRYIYFITDGGDQTKSDSLELIKKNSINVTICTLGICTSDKDLEFLKTAASIGQGNCLQISNIDETINLNSRLMELMNFAEQKKLKNFQIEAKTNYDCVPYFTKNDILEIKNYTIYFICADFDRNVKITYYDENRIENISIKPTIIEISVDMGLDKFFAAKKIVGLEKSLEQNFLQLKETAKKKNLDSQDYQLKKEAIENINKIKKEIVDFSVNHQVPSSKTMMVIQKSLSKGREKENPQENKPINSKGKNHEEPLEKRQEKTEEIKHEKLRKAKTLKNLQEKGKSENNNPFIYKNPEKQIPFSPEIKQNFANLPETRKSDSIIEINYSIQDPSLERKKNYSNKSNEFHLDQIEELSAKPKQKNLSPKYENNEENKIVNDEKLEYVYSQDNKSDESETKKKKKLRKDQELKKSTTGNIEKPLSEISKKNEEKKSLSDAIEMEKETKFANSRIISPLAADYKSHLPIIEDKEEIKEKNYDRHEKDYDRHEKDYDRHEEDYDSHKEDHEEGHGMNEEDYPNIWGKNSESSKPIVNAEIIDNRMLEIEISEEQEIVEENGKNIEEVEDNLDANNFSDAIIVDAPFDYNEDSINENEELGGPEHLNQPFENDENNPQNQENPKNNMYNFPKEYQTLKREIIKIDVQLDKTLDLLAYGKGAYWEKTLLVFPVLLLFNHRLPALNITKEITSTVFVLALLEIQYSEFHYHWEEKHDKSIKWLKQNNFDYYTHHDIYLENIISIYSTTLYFPKLALPRPDIETNYTLVTLLLKLHNGLYWNYQVVSSLLPNAESFNLGFPCSNANAKSTLYIISILFKYFKEIESVWQKVFELSLKWLKTIFFNQEPEIDFDFKSIFLNDNIKLEEDFTDAVFNELVQMSYVEGYWDFDAVNHKFGQLENIFRMHGWENNKNALATLFVISIFESKYSYKILLWERIKMKADKWLKQSNLSCKDSQLLFNNFRSIFSYKVLQSQLVYNRFWHFLLIMSVSNGIYWELSVVTQLFSGLATCYEQSFLFLKPDEFATLVVIKYLEDYYSEECTEWYGSIKTATDWLNKSQKIIHTNFNDKFNIYEILKVPRMYTQEEYLMNSEVITAKTMFEHCNNECGTVVVRNIDGFFTVVYI